MFGIYTHTRRRAHMNQIFCGQRTNAWHTQFQNLTHINSVQECLEYWKLLDVERSSNHPAALMCMCVVCVCVCVYVDIDYAAINARTVFPNCIYIRYVFILFSRSAGSVNILGHKFG